MERIFVFQNIDSSVGLGIAKTMPGLKSWRNFGFDPP
jgi:hypothetical protein